MKKYYNIYKFTLALVSIIKLSSTASSIYIYIYVCI